MFEYIVFRGSDVKDLKVEEAAKKVEPPPRGVPDDPAILAVCILQIPWSFVPFAIFDELLRISFSQNYLVDISVAFLLIFQFSRKQRLL